MYASHGRPSIPPEHLLKGSLLIALYSVRSERQFCEQLRYNLLLKWFLDLNVEDEPFNATTFSKNRERLLEAEVARAFFAEVVAEAGRRRLLLDEHFTVDGPLLGAWASLKGYRPRDERAPPSGGGRNAEVDFQGRRRSRETHVSRTDAEARLYRKGPQQEAKLRYLGHVLSENRHGLVADVELSEANGYGEREAALRMLERSVRGRATLGADRGYDTRAFVQVAREMGLARDTVRRHLATPLPEPRKRKRSRPVLERVRPRQVRRPRLHRAFVQQATNLYVALGLEETVAYYNAKESVDGQWYVFIIDPDG